MVNPCFVTAETWADAAALVEFEPVVPPVHWAGPPQCLRVHVADHKRRDLPIRDRSVEAFYAGLVFTQSHKARHEAHRLVFETDYGSCPRRLSVAGHPARAFELGPEVAVDDIDGRAPAVVVWHRDGLFCLLASDRETADALVARAAMLMAG